MRETDLTTSHINTFCQVLLELSSQGINFEEEVKALALLSSLPTSWEVFCTTFANNCPKVNMERNTEQVLIEDIRWKSMGLTIDESTEAHHLTESIERSSQSRGQIERKSRNTRRPRKRGDWQRSKSRNSWSSAFYTHRRKTDHNVSHCWLIKAKENCQWFDQTTSNQVNVAKSRPGEILTL